MNADGSDQTRLTANTAREDLPVWTADGRIIFVSDRDGDPDLYVVDADGANVEQFIEDPSLDFFPATAPNGDGVVFMSDRDGTFDLYRTTTRGGPVKRVTDPAFADTWPNWSPHGNDIAFVRSEGRRPRPLRGASGRDKPRASHR